MGISDSIHCIDATSNKDVPLRRLFGDKVSSFRSELETTDDYLLLLKNYLPGYIVAICEHTRERIVYSCYNEKSGKIVFIHMAETRFKKGNYD